MKKMKNKRKTKRSHQNQEGSSKKMKECTTDRISLLPDFIVHHIMSYLLDDPKSRLRMSVLSKEWSALTASFPILSFGRCMQALHMFSAGEYVDYERFNERFFKYVQSTVSRFCKQNISPHKLEIYVDCINLEHRELFRHCLDLVLEKGLQAMDIQFRDTPNLPVFRLPNTLLSASALTSLRLHFCELPQSLMGGVVKLVSLRLLSLSCLSIDEGVIEYLTNGCPLLEEIDLTSCRGFKTFCVNMHQNLLKVEIYCHSRCVLERIHVDAPNLSHFLVESNKYKNFYKNKTISMFLGSSKKLTTFCYRGFPLERFSDFLSDFPFLENVDLNLPVCVNNLKLSNNSFREICLHSDCDLDEINLNTPNLLLFKYHRRDSLHNFAPLSYKDSSLAKGCMECDTSTSFDIHWFQKLRRFLDKNDIFKVLKLVVYWDVKDVEKLKVIQSPPRELEHVELIHKHHILEVSHYANVLDAVLWCCRPRSLTLQLDRFSDKSDVKYTYEKLLQQEDEGQTHINFVLVSSSEDKQHFSDLDSLLITLSCGQSRYKVTFIKEQG